MCTIYMFQRLTNNTDITLNVVFFKINWGKRPKGVTRMSLFVLSFNAACTEFLWVSVSGLL